MVCFIILRNSCLSVHKENGLKYPKLWCHIRTPRPFILLGLRENLWNLPNCIAWATVCRYNNSENGAVDRPTLLPLSCIQNKSVSVAWHVRGLYKNNARVEILGREWLCCFLTTDFTNHTWMFYLLFPTGCVKKWERKKEKVMCMNIKHDLNY